MWKSVGKGTLWLGGALTIGGAALVAWNLLGDFSQDQSERAEAASVKSGSFDQYRGARIGMIKNEVLYLKGKPQAIRKQSEGGEAWIYDYNATYEYATTLFFNASGALHRIACQGHESWNCDSIGGLAIGDEEPAVIEKLGWPVKAPMISDKGVKTMLFGQAGKYWVVVTLEQARVSGFVVGGRS